MTFLKSHDFESAGGVYVDAVNAAEYPVLIEVGNSTFTIRDAAGMGTFANGMLCAMEIAAQKKGAA